MSLTKLSLRAIPALASKIDDEVDPTKSVELDGDERVICQRLRPDISTIRAPRYSHNLILGVLEDSLEGTVSSLLDGLLDLLVRGTLLEPGDQVDDRDVGSGDSESHSSELSVEAGDDLADGLGGTGGRGDDVGTSTSSASPCVTRKNTYQV